MGNIMIPILTKKRTNKPMAVVEKVILGLTAKQKI